MTEFVIFKMKWLVEWFALIVFCFALYIAFSKYGNIKIGKDTDTPEFSTFSWASMCICSGVGFGALLWFSSEGLFHLFESSHVINAGNAGKAAGVPLAIASGYMNWGIFGWAIYALCGIAVALPAYRLDRPFNLAGGLYGILGDRAYTSIWGKGADLVGAVGSAGGPAAGLGVGLLLLTSGITAMTGYTIGLYGQMGLVVFFCLAYTFSAYIGIEKGMKRLSELAILSVFLLVCYVFIAGPTLYIANTITESFGEYLSNFMSFNFFTDAGNFVTQKDGTAVPEARSWQSWWYTFYIVWWVAHAPFTGGFFARISRGRTLRQFILGVVCFPTLLVIVVMGVLSSAACYLQVTGEVDMYGALVKETGSSIYNILLSYPFPKLSIAVAIFCVVIFGVTTFDSATYFVSVQASCGNINPKPAMKLMWGILLGSVALIFLTIGNFNGLKGLGVLAGVPFFFYLIAYMVSVLRMCRMIDDKKL